MIIYPIKIDKFKKRLLSVIVATLGCLVILLVIILVVFVVIRKYQQYQVGQAKKDQQINEQQLALENTQKEVQGLKQEIGKGQNNPSGVLGSATTISSSDISPYLASIVQIVCGSSLGSGSLWDFGGSNSDNFGVLTNNHVVKKPGYVLDNKGNPSCYVRARDKDGLYDLGSYDLDFSSRHIWNDIADEAFQSIEINKVIESKSSHTSTPIENLDYISGLRQCPSQMALNSPVAVVGYPAYAITQFNQNDSSYALSSRIITNGVISGYDQSVVVPPSNLPEPNYYVSAKLDSGNSGGLAFSKDSKGLCILGIPTWVSVGNYENSGMVQNIKNIFYEN